MINPKTIDYRNGLVFLEWLEIRRDVRDFIQTNYQPYDGNEDFLEVQQQATDKLWDVYRNFRKKNAKGGVLDMDTVLYLPSLHTDRDI